MLAHPVTRQSLACIRCGACLNVCPVYQQIGGHAYGSVYPGPIGAVITPQLIGIEKAKQLPYASSLCGACREVCPVKIDIPRLLLHLRDEIKKTSWTERWAFKLWAAIMLRPSVYEATAGAARVLQRWFKPPLKAWTNGRDLRPIEEESFRERWRRTHGN
jgi:L-lactate dehydrogenase complex protein LldF